MWDIYYHPPRQYWKTSWIFVVFALIAAGFTFGPQRVESLHRLDVGAAKWINSGVGVSQTWDVVLGALNHDRAIRPIAAGLIILIYLIYAWRQRYYDMGRLLGFLVWMGAGVALGLSLAYWVSERLESHLDIRGPRYTLTDFQDLNHLHEGWHVDVKDRNSVPSRQASVYFVVLAMAFFRSRGLGFALLAPILILSGSAVAVGREWPSSLLAGVFWGAGVAAFLTRTPLAAAPRWLEGISFDWVEHYLTFWAPTSPWKGRRPSPALLRATGRTAAKVLVPAPSDREEAALAELIRRYVIPFLAGVDGSEIEIRRAPPGDAGFPRPSPHVRFVTGAGLDPCIVVKGAWKCWAAFRSEGWLARRRNAADVHTVLQFHGVPVPSLLLRREGRSALSTTAFHLTAESFVAGRPLRVQSPEDCALAGAVLARMHAIERSDAGGVCEGIIPRARYPHRAILPRAQRYAAKIDIEMPASQVAFFGAHTAEWLWRRTVEILELGAPFALCHKNLAARHALIRDGDAYLVDFAASGYGFAGLDVAKALVEWGSGDEAATRAVAESYFAARKAAQWERFREGFDLFVSMTALACLFDWLQQPEEQRLGLDGRRLSDLSAHAMQGNIERPATPAEAADLTSHLFFAAKAL